MANPVGRGVRTRLAFGILARSLSFFGALIGAAIFLQLLLLSADGDPISMLPVHGEAFDSLRPSLEREWGLQGSTFDQLSRFIGRTIRGDLGTSLVLRPWESVYDISRARWAHSCRILFPALFLSLLCSLALAWLTAGRPLTKSLKHLLQTVSILPIFLFSCVIFLVDGYTKTLVDSGGIDRPEWFPLFEGKESSVQLCLAILVLAFCSNSLTEMHAALENRIVVIRQSGYILAAQARGAPAWPHILRNLMPDVMSLAASRVALMIGGLVILEKVFVIKGAGHWIWEACRARDYPLAMGLVLGGAAIVCAMRLLSDVFHLVWDPRYRAGGP